MNQNHAFKNGVAYEEKAIITLHLEQKWGFNDVKS